MFVMMEEREFIEARVRVEKNVWLAIKARAALQNIPVSDFVGEILRREVKKYEE